MRTIARDLVLISLMAAGLWESVSPSPQRFHKSIGLSEVYAGKCSVVTAPLTAWRRDITVEAKGNFQL